MGSRIMHLIIANQTAGKLSITDKHSFLLGGVAPDAVSNKDLSHFYSGSVDDYSRKVNYQQFLKKYRELRKNPFILGYYAHLIADDIWLNGFYLPWLKNRMDNDQNIFNLYHTDFKNLNGQLLSFYGVTTDLIKEITVEAFIPRIEETKEEAIIDIIDYIVQDMTYNSADVETPLFVFTFEQIIG
jgi:hypothetical protein